MTLGDVEKGIVAMDAAKDAALRVEDKSAENCSTSKSTRIGPYFCIVVSQLMTHRDMLRGC